MSVPKGFSVVTDCCVGEHLKFGLYGTDYPPLWTFSADTGEYNGYLRQLLDILSLEMGFTYEFTSRIDPISDMLGGAIDASVADGAAAEAHTMILDKAVYTAPFLVSHTSALANRSAEEPGLDQVFQPFTWPLWGTLLLSMLCFAAVLVLIESIWPTERASIGKRRTLSQYADSFVRASYHMFAALVGGDDHEYFTLPARLLRLSLLFVVLVTGATYTANLAAFLTKRKVTLGGPTNLEGLAHARACISEPTYAWYLGPFVTIISGSQTRRPATHTYTHQLLALAAPCARGSLRSLLCLV